MAIANGTRLEISDEATRNQSHHLPNSVAELPQPEMV